MPESTTNGSKTENVEYMTSRLVKLGKAGKEEKAREKKREEEKAEREVF